MKLLLTLLIVILIAIMPMAAWGQGILATEADTANWQDGAFTTSDLILSDWWSGPAILDSLHVSTAFGSAKHDTTKEYVKEVADKCDTTWGKHWVKYKKIDGEQYFKRMAKIDSVHCYIDTVWADKKLVYFTPDELKILRDIIKCH